jgi:hypothetical protein
MSTLLILLDTKSNPMRSKMNRRPGERSRMIYLRTVGEIPEFATLEEEAAFWETHSPLEILDQLEPVRVQLSKGLQRRLGERLLVLCLSAPQIARVRELAHNKRVSSLELVRRWIEAGLQRYGT